MEFLQGDPVVVYAAEIGRDVKVGSDHGWFGVCADGNADDDAKGAASASSEGPEEIRVLVFVCNDEFSLGMG